MAQDLVTVVPGSNFALPALFTPDLKAAKRFIEFFTASIRNLNTRRAYSKAVTSFAGLVREYRDF